MKTKLCLPIIKISMKDVVREIESHKQNYDMFEVWLDYINEPTPVILNLFQDLSIKFPERIILVFRRQNGETINMPFEKRIEIIKQLEQASIFFDVDIEQQKKDLEEIKRLRLRPQIIASFHDYEKTPRTSGLVNIIEDMEMFNPKIYKIATFCETPKQAITLMHLLLDLKEQKKDVIILGMGLHGKITRIFGALYGNEITFVPETKNEQSAPEQLTRKELESIIQIMH